MATIEQHNNLFKCVFDGSKHLKHVLDSKEINKLAMIEKRYPVTRLPVCGHCEKLAYWHHNHTAWCPKCGTYTMKPITYSDYLASGFDTDGVTARRMLDFEKKRKRRNRILPAYGE